MIERIYFNYINNTIPSNKNNWKREHNIRNVLIKQMKSAIIKISLQHGFYSKFFNMSHVIKTDKIEKNGYHLSLKGNNHRKAMGVLGRVEVGGQF